MNTEGIFGERKRGGHKLFGLDNECGLSWLMRERGSRRFTFNGRLAQCEGRCAETRRAGVQCSRLRFDRDDEANRSMNYDGMASHTRDSCSLKHTGGVGSFRCRR